MKLFGRKWSVQIDRALFEGLDMSFSVVKSTKPEPNTCSLRLFNLSSEQRSALESTPLVKIPTKGAGGPRFQHLGIPVRIDAGYEEADSLIWHGDLRTVESTHDGADWVTELGSGDGEEAYRKSRVNLSFGPGTPIATILRTLASALGVGVGNSPLFIARVAANATLATLSAQGLVLTGSVAEQLSHLTRSVGLEWSIQDGSLQFAERGVPVLGRAVLLSAATGLTGEPAINQQGVLSARMLMIPGVLPGSVLVLDSERIKGNYRIEQATYEGDSSGQPWYITVECKPF